MTIWEKAVLNIEKGFRKLTAAAATFSERVKAELAIIRLRIRIDEVQDRIDALHRIIGRKIMDLKKQEALPKTTELLLKADEIVIAMTELADREQEIGELRAQMKNVQTDVQTTEKQTEDTLA
jgi:predicted  nucleic acid-binding Zn-ribbon protein